MTKQELWNSMREMLGDDPELLDEIGNEYILEAEKRLRDGVCALESSDYLELRRAAHTLKGCSANVGAETLRQLSYEWQVAAEEQDSEKCRSLQSKIADELAGIR